MRMAEYLTLLVDFLLNATHTHIAHSLQRAYIYISFSVEYFLFLRYHLMMIMICMFLYACVSISILFLFRYSIQWSMMIKIPTKCLLDVHLLCRAIFTFHALTHTHTYTHTRHPMVSVVLCVFAFYVCVRNL